VVAKKLTGRSAAPGSAESDEGSEGGQSARGSPLSAERAAAVLSEKSRRVLSPTGVLSRAAVSSRDIELSPAGPPVRSAPTDGAVAAAAAVMAAAGG